MNSNRLLAFIPWTLFSLGLFLHLPAPSVVAQEDQEALPNAALLQALGKRWKLQREDLSLVEIEYRSVRRKVQDGHSIGREQVRKLIRRLVKPSGPKTLVEVAEALDPTLKGKQPAWANGIFLMDGESFLCEESRPGRVNRLFTVVRHGGYELQANFVMRDWLQVDVMWEQTRIKHGPQGLSDFVVLSPAKSLNAVQFAKLQVRDEEGRLTISDEIAEFIVSSVTGFVHESKKGKYGSRSYSETIQFRPQKHSNTIVMPELYFQGNYSGSRLTSFSLRLIDKITTNPKAISKNFQIPVLPGDTVIDHTGATREMIKVSKATNDVFDLVFDLEQPRIPMESKR